MQDDKTWRGLQPWVWLGYEMASELSIKCSYLGQGFTGTMGTLCGCGGFTFSILKPRPQPPQDSKEQSWGEKSGLNAVGEGEAYRGEGNQTVRGP